MMHRANPGAHPLDGADAWPGPTLAAARAGPRAPRRPARRARSGMDDDESAADRDDRARPGGQVGSEDAYVARPPARLRPGCASGESVATGVRCGAAGPRGPQRDRGPRRTNVNTAPYVETLGRAGNQATARGAGRPGGIWLSGRRRAQPPAGRLGQRTALVSGDADSSVLAMDWTLEAQGQLLSRPRGRQSGRRGRPRRYGAQYRVRIVDEALVQRLVYIDFAADQPAALRTSPGSRRAMAAVMEALVPAPGYSLLDGARNTESVALGRGGGQSPESRRVE